MDPLPHPRVTRAFGAPASWDAESHGPCSTLEISDIVTEDRLAMMESLWQPTVEELNALNRGGVVVLCIYGVTHPVVSIGAAEPEQVQP
jgi:hypothetical protein